MRPRNEPVCIELTAYWYRIKVPAGNTFNVELYPDQGWLVSGPDGKLTKTYYTMVIERSQPNRPNDGWAPLATKKTAMSAYLSSSVDLVVTPKSIKSRTLVPGGKAVAPRPQGECYDVQKEVASGQIVQLAFTACGFQGR